MQGWGRVACHLTNHGSGTFYTLSDAHAGPDLPAGVVVRKVNVTSSRGTWRRSDSTKGEGYSRWA